MYPVSLLFVHPPLSPEHLGSPGVFGGVRLERRGERWGCSVKSSVQNESIRTGMKVKNETRTKPIDSLEQGVVPSSAPKCGERLGSKGSGIQGSGGTVCIGFWGFCGSGFPEGVFGFRCNSEGLLLHDICSQRFPPSRVQPFSPSLCSFPLYPSLTFPLSYQTAEYSP